MTTPIFPSVIGHNLLDGGTDAQDGNNYPGPLLSEYAAAVAGSAGSPRRDGRIMLFGDSHVSREHLNVGTTDVSNINYGMLNHANILGGRRWEITYNFGVSGESALQMLSRIDAALAVVGDVDVVLISAGTNDIFSEGATSAVTISRLETIFRAFLAKGVFVIWKNEMPRTFIDATKVRYQHDLNAWGREFERTNPGFSVFDAAAVVVNPTSTQYQAATNMLQDGVHWSNYGACLVGKAFAAKYSSMFLPRANLISSASDTYAVNSSSGQIFNNPLFSGTGGTKTATGGGTAPTGTVADLVNVDHPVNTAGTCTASLVTQADGFGQAQRVVIANNGASDRFLVQTINQITDGVSPGDLIEAEADIRIASHTNLSSVTLILRTAVDGGTVVIATDCRYATGDIAMPADYIGRSYRTRRLRIPAGAAITTLQPRVEVRFTTATGGGATVDVGRLSIRNLTRLGLDT